MKRIIDPALPKALIPVAKCTLLVGSSPCHQRMRRKVVSCISSPIAFHRPIDPPIV
jgi:hypothetical protein